MVVIKSVNMLIIVGLGNPGKKYEKTRHNIGSRIIDELKYLKFKNVILAKPKTFMNESGNAVKNLLKNYHLKPNNLITIHDDIDIPLGKIKISAGHGSAGHKGVESIIKKLKSKNFIRFRIGICPKLGKPKNPEAFVLQNFNKEEEKIVKEVIKKTAEAIEIIIKEGIEKAMNEFNK
jgi:PTH1 family peptidyl-tRNA hydrolase